MTEARAPLVVGEVVPDLMLLDHRGRPWLVGGPRERPLMLILHRHLA